MPQIGWFEILIIVVLSIVIIGPKDFPIVIRKIGTWIGSAKTYFNDIQKNITEVESTMENEISLEDQKPNYKKENNKDE
jgi:sec-independent protein translocase protein TatB|tara:strand:- start:1010 stop:1246 length:237 start_codon:yes stop_codon:yes gene_type:complete